MESAHHFSSKSDCDTMQQMSIPEFCVPLSQQSHLSRIDGVLTYNDSMTILHRLSQIPPTELPNRVPQKRIDDDSHPSRRFLWSAVVKSPKFSALGTTVPVRLLQGALVILVRKQISQFLSLGKLVLIMCFLDTNLARRSESESWEVFASAGTCVSSNLSVISSNHSGRSRKRLSSACLSFLFLLFGLSLRFPDVCSSLRFSNSCSMSPAWRQSWDRRREIWINCEFALLWSCWSRCRHYSCSNRRKERSCVRILKLVNVFRQIPRCFAGASFWVESFVMWSFPECWRPRTTLMRRPLLDNNSWWTLSFPNFNFVPSAFEGFDGVFRSQFSFFTLNK